ncbi:uncharacterized protein LOC124279768 [Haliotis rubra]|uniref:uncharacterized protein LOC124279768 n=1 Tax=Haliotis rubra TaxID=36100 RepID=UPI001EE57B35|nr:uncharacterized protein LOC124279768 [Haliotis rubra]XP_046571604.1 uncharacterized protein LOC124279768 [Haliotis rubra]XP_046571605.1 uncharacterized protein LOC124279768 [Haliotis rubra]XP_046571606.1 uncharacterized protein LOC124279768 [Haliotis rubra]XP_046571607.1 uncharacterized protein LOC124279768 [Haliotis rubra]
MKPMKTMKTGHYTTEDIQNIPDILKDLNVQDLQEDPDRLSLQDRCEMCLFQGRGEAKHSEYKDALRRRESYGGTPVRGHSPQSLAESGLFRSASGTVTCYQCGQSLRLVPGEDPAYKHADLYRNCSHVWRMLGRRSRRELEASVSPSVAVVAVRRRLFST